MAKKKISQLPAGSALTGLEIVPIVQTGTTKRITAQDIANLGNASGVEGSGTINQITKFTASSTIGDSKIYDDGANVGIETTTAINRFIMSANASIAKIFSFRSGNLPRWAFRVDGTESGANAGADLAIRRYNDAGTFIDAPLSIDRSTGVSTFNSGTLNQNTQIFGNKVGMSRTSDGAEVVYFSKNTDLGTEGTANINGYDGIQFRTQGTESVKMTIKSNGEAVFNGNDINIRSASGSGNYLFFTESSVADRYLIGSPAGSGDLVFRSGAYNFSTGTETMRITSAGDVGIGTDNPANLLQVKGNGNNMISLQYASDGGSAGYGFYNSAGTELWSIGGGRFTAQDALEISRQGSLKFLINSAGNVGINTTTPSRTLSVNGQIGLSDDLISTNGSNVLRLGYNSYYGSSGFNLTTENSIPLTFGTASTERMRIFADGNIAINSTTNAGYKLDVNGTARVQGNLKVGSASGAVATPTAIQMDDTYRTGGDAFDKLKFYFYKGATESYGFGLGDLADIQYWAGSSSGGIHRFFTSQTERFRIKENGVINIASIPTSPVGLSTGDIWNDGGTLKIV
jgi:hypothetical protein